MTFKEVAGLIAARGLESKVAQAVSSNDAKR